MDYYEELGIDRTATAVEIRRTYRRLARLLHPDHCKDEATRRVADIQMKRLNAMVATLTDEGARKAYDRSLVEPQLPAPASARRSIPIGAWVAMAVMLCATALAVLVRPSQPAKAALPPVEDKGGAARAPAAETNAAARRRGGMIAKPAPQGLEPPRRVRPAEPDPEGGRAEAPAPRAIEEAEPMPGPVFAHVAMPQIPHLGSLAEPPPPPSLAGEWLYVRGEKTADRDLYPPEYIELRIMEASGILRGRYRGRYRVKDQAISPNVEFQFAGRGHGRKNAEAIAWQGAGGSRGTVTLRLLDNGTLEVEWMARELGSEMGLIAGTAVLVRKRE